MILGPTTRVSTTSNEAISAQVPEERLPATLPQLQAALRKTTEYLARELAQPTDRAPAWSDIEWRTARAVVTIHGVSGLLAAQLRWEGPRGWRPFLAEQRALIAARQPRLRGFLEELDRAARSRGLALVALKGAALHALGVYSPGERPMADIDLLCDPEQAESAAEVLAGLGLRAGPATWKHREFAAPAETAGVVSLGESATGPVKVELHARLREILPLRPVDVTAAAWPGSPHPGLNDYGTSEGLMLHMLLHASGAISGRTLRLLHLVDLSRLARRMDARAWEALFESVRGTPDPDLWWAYPPLLLTERYFGGVPQGVLERLAAACRWPLRRAFSRRTLTDVSISHLWVSAFPGIEWARSLPEMAAYAVRRFSPSAETRALRQAFAESQPLVSGGEWSRTSQRRRIVRWLLARQPRQETLHPLRASLLGEDL